MPRRLLEKGWWNECRWINWQALKTLLTLFHLTFASHVTYPMTCLLCWFNQMSKEYEDRNAYRVLRRLFWEEPSTYHRIAVDRWEDKDVGKNDLIVVDFTYTTMFYQSPSLCLSTHWDYLLLSVAFHSSLASTKLIQTSAGADISQASENLRIEILMMGVRAT